MVDFWREIFDYLQRRLGQSVASCIGIIWGIFIMIVLVGVGTGFEYGIYRLFEDFSKGCTYVYAGETSKVSSKSSIGKQISFKEEDIAVLKKTTDAITAISPEISQWFKIKYKGKEGDFELKGISEDYLKIKKINVSSGRFLNKLDFDESRKTVVIGKNVVDVLFKNEDPIGRSVEINGSFFSVVGILKNTQMGYADERACYLPLSTFNVAITDSEEFKVFLYDVENQKKSKEVEEIVRNKLSQICGFDKTDDRAIYISSIDQQVGMFTSFFDAIKYFMWFVGISTLVGGIIGVGNIMNATVRERTREIGIRKAIGAKSMDIKKMIIAETLTITFISGVVGILLGWLVLLLIGCFISEDSLIMTKPHLDVVTTIFSMIVLIVSGVLAGLKPASYAASLQPIEALRRED